MKKRSRRRRGDAGFTLVEMSVAMVILAIVFAALGAFLITSVATQYNNELRAKAVQIGNQAIEDGRALQWDLLGFYADDGQAAACGTTDGPVVTIPVPVSPAVKNPRVPTAGPKTVPVNGTDYTATTCYRWIDDDNDGLGAADTNGTEDVKRIEVSISWTERGTARTHDVEALRAPTSAEVAPRSATGQPAFGIQSVTPDPASANSAGIDAAGKLTSALMFTATTSTAVSTVQLRWTDGNGDQQLQTLSAGTSSTSWSLTLPVGTGVFAPVLTTFTFSAYSATGETSNQDTKVSFSQTPGSLALSSVTASPNSIDVNSAGMSATAFTVTATTNDDATSGVLRYVNRNGGEVTVSMTAESARKFTYTFPVGSGPFKDDATQFSASVNGVGGTATSSTTVTFVPPAVIPVSLVSHVVTPQLCVENDGGRVAAATQFQVVTEGISVADVVTIQLNDTANTRVTADHVSTDGNSSYFTYDLTTESALAFAKGQLSASVTATRKSDNTQATQLYTSDIFRRNGNETCPT